MSDIILIALSYSLGYSYCFVRVEYQLRFLVDHLSFINVLLLDRLIKAYSFAVIDSWSVEALVFAVYLRLLSRCDICVGTQSTFHKNVFSQVVLFAILGITCVLFASTFFCMGIVFLCLNKYFVLIFVVSETVLYMCTQPVIS